VITITEFKLRDGETSATVLKGNGWLVKSRFGIEQFSNEQDAQDRAEDIHLELELSNV